MKRSSQDLDTEELDTEELDTEELDTEELDTEELNAEKVSAMSRLPPPHDQRTRGAGAARRVPLAMSTCRDSALWSG
jgi:hypothetical protein